MKNKCKSSAHKIYKVMCHEFWGCKVEKKSQVGWTSWYCPIKNCDQIIYNTNGLRDDIGSHLRTHGLIETPIW